MTSPRPSDDPGGLRVPAAALLRRLAGLVRPYRGRVALILLLSLVATGLGLLAPLVLRRLIDEVVVRGQGQRLDRLGLSLLGLLVASATVGTIAGLVYTGLTARVLLDLRLGTLRHLGRLPPAFFQRVPTGEIMARLTGDVAELQSAATGALLRLITLVVNVVGSLVLLGYLSWRLLLLALVALPLAAASARLLRPRTERLATELRDHTARLGTELLDSVLGMRAIQAEGRVAGAARRFLRQARLQIRAVLRYQLTSSLAGAAAQLSVYVGTALCLGYGAHLVGQGVLTWGTLGAFVVYLARLYGPLQGFTGLYLQLQRAGVSARRLLEIEGVEPGAREPERGRALELRGEVGLEDVRFAYREADGQAPGPPVLDGLSLHIRPGEVVALVGPSGAGKSTLVELLLRFHDPDAGVVRYDGVDVRELRLAHLRSQVAWVSLEPYLLHASVAENLAYGRSRPGEPPPTRAELEEAARMADAHDFIEALPQGYDTPVGERGARLSSGQKQRLALARALLGRPRLLILDEALAAVDPVSSEVIFAALSRLAGTTVLLVTHRQELAARAARVLRLEGGRVVEETSTVATAATASTAAAGKAA